mmetsp:Transcript_13495/g.17016  ORF Transcript_13495/g.17016 Transcript_13495/m.17016 type:complete len:98 (+) Transcript_13495:143-436(+)
MISAAFKVYPSALRGKRSVSNILAKLGGSSAVPEKLLNVLACPLTKEPLKLKKQWWPGKPDMLVCESLQIGYEIKDELPNMIPADARMLQQENKPSS